MKYKTKVAIVCTVIYKKHEIFDDYVCNVLI